MKRILCLILALISIFAVCSCSCIRSEDKYDYDLSEYMSIPDYKNQVFDIDENDIKHAIGAYLMQFAAEYTVKRGDKIQVDMKFYDLLDPEVDAKGKEITELFQEGLWLENVATPDSDSEYQISNQIENGLLGAKMGATVSKIFTISNDFFVEEYRGKRMFVDTTIKNRECEAGDVLTASYTGYYIDKDGKIIKEDGKEKTFDSSDNSPFYVGSHLAIDDVENGLIGMTIGNEKDIYATFPDDYEPDKTLAGKKVLFKVKIKAFFTPSVYDDDFVKTYFSSFQNTKEFEDALIKENTISKVYEYIDANTQIFEYPSAEYEESEYQLESIAVLWYQQYSMTLEQYVQNQYGMSIDQYIKSNMKSEMIFYYLRDLIGTDAIPTETEIAAKKKDLVEQYKKEYMTSKGLTESQAIVEANEYVEALGDSYVYEQVMYGKIDNIIPTQVKTNFKKTDIDYIFDAKTE